jgi:hypothetical protein
VENFALQMGAQADAAGAFYTLFLGLDAVALLGGVVGVILGAVCTALTEVHRVSGDMLPS